MSKSWSDKSRRCQSCTNNVVISLTSVCVVVFFVYLRTCLLGLYDAALYSDHRWQDVYSYGTHRGSYSRWPFHLPQREAAAVHWRQSVEHFHTGQISNQYCCSLNVNVRFKWYSEEWFLMLCLHSYVWRWGICTRRRELCTGISPLTTLCLERKTKSLSVRRLYLSFPPCSLGVVPLLAN